MKILHVITSSSWGGLELYVKDLVVELHKSGVSQAVFCLEHSVIAEELRVSGVPLYYAKERSKFNLTDIQYAYWLVKKHGFDIVHTHANTEIWLGCWLVCLKPGLRHVFSQYMGVVKKKDFLHRFVYNRVHALVSSAEQTNREMAEKYPVDSSRIHLIRYGREIEKFRTDDAVRESIRHQYQAGKEVVIAGTMARIDYQKGLKELAESVLLLPKEIREKLMVWIIGERCILRLDEQGNRIYESESEQLYNWLVDFIRNNGLESNLKLIPFQKEYVGYLSAMDIFVLPSWNEMYALSVLDAMLMGLPVIGTDSGGTTEQLGNGQRGLLVPVKDTSGIAAALEKLVKSKEERNQLGSSGIEWVRNAHSWTNTVNEWKLLYGKLLKK